MHIAIIENDVVKNVVVVPDDADPSAFGGIALPDGLWIGDHLPPTQLDRVEAQVTYTAMMTDTLLEED